MFFRKSITSSAEKQQYNVEMQQYKDTKIKKSYMQKISDLFKSYYSTDKVTFNDQVLTGLQLGWINIPIMFLTSIIQKQLFSILTPPNLPMEIYRNPRNLAIILPLGCIIFPVSEELVYRGIVLSSLHWALTKMGVQEQYANWGAIFGSSVCFAAAHPTGAFAYAVIAGMELGAVTLSYQGSLITSTTAHIMNNCITQGLVVAAAYTSKP